MKIIFFLAAFLAFMNPCRADDEEDMIDGTLLHAMELIHVYYNYELDVFVNGQGNTTISRQCRGSGDQKQCTFDEFVNYVTTGKASGSPQYYEFEAAFTLTIGDVFNIVAAIRRVYNGGSDEINRIIKGRKTAIGLLDDLARIYDKNYKAPVVDGSSKADRLLRGIGVTLKGVAAFGDMRNKLTLKERLKNIRDVTWVEINIQDEYNKNKHKKLDWSATVARNPALSNRNSKAFQAVADALRETTGRVAYRETQTKVAKAQRAIEACH